MHWLIFDLLNLSQHLNASTINRSSGEYRKSLCCSHTQGKDVDESSDLYDRKNKRVSGVTGHMYKKFKLCLPKLVVSLYIKYL